MNYSMNYVNVMEVGDPLVWLLFVVLTIYTLIFWSD